MQHRLQHGELVEVGAQQRSHDRGECGLCLSHRCRLCVHGGANVLVGSHEMNCLNSSAVITLVPVATARSNSPSASWSKPGPGLMQSRSRTTCGAKAGERARKPMNWS